MKLIHEPKIPTKRCSKYLVAIRGLFVVLQYYVVLQRLNTKYAGFHGFRPKQRGFYTLCTHITEDYIVIKKATRTSTQRNSFALEQNTESTLASLSLTGHTCTGSNPTH